MSVRVPATRTRVGKYELGKTVGEGSFAKVKIATNVNTGDTFAIKILDRVHVLRHKMVEQIKREISTMKLIKHPNVIKVFEVMASETKIYIVLEFVDGGELFDKIAKNGRLKEDEARRYFQQLINVVDYCHSRGGYHRDLKVLNNKGYGGTASDIWSCGVILFVLMAGYLIALYGKISRAEFSCGPWFSSGAKKLIKRILEPNPLMRMTIPEILEDEWFKKGYRPPQFEQEEDVNLDDIVAVYNDSQEHLVTEKKEKPVSMNAFELISRSQGFNLETLFEMQKGPVKRETQFTSQSSPNEIMSKIEEAAKPLELQDEEATR